MHRARQPEHHQSADLLKDDIKSLSRAKQVSILDMDSLRRDKLERRLYQNVELGD